MSEIDLELPRDDLGNLNYDVLGKILTAKLMGEVVCASHVDKKHNCVMSGANFKADTDWERCRESNNVVVLRKKTQPTCFMGRGVIDAPLQVVADFIKDIRSTFTWDDMLVDASYVKVFKETEKESDYLGYQRFETNRYCGMLRVQRDLLYFVHCTFVHTLQSGQHEVFPNCHSPAFAQKEDKYVHSAMSIEDPNFPPVHGIPRMFIHMGSGFVIESYEKDPHKTLVSYLAHIDTKGIPSVVNNYVLNRHPMAIARIRARLEKGPNFASESLACSLLPGSPRRSASCYEDAVNTKDFVHGFSS